VVGCGCREIDADASDRVPAAKRVERVACARTQIDDDGGVRKIDRDSPVTHRVDQRASNAAVEQRRARHDRILRVAGVRRPPILRLQHVDVAAPRDVVRVPVRTDECALAPLEGERAESDGACERR
jgi:hypothetical protein